MDEELKHELFHIIHSAIWHINEERVRENEILILDREIWNSIQKIIISNKKLFKFLKVSN